MSRNWPDLKTYNTGISYNHILRPFLTSYSSRLAAAATVYLVLNGYPEKGLWKNGESIRPKEKRDNKMYRVFNIIVSNSKNLI